MHKCIIIDKIKIKKMKSPIKYIISISIILLLSWSCTKDFEEINTNPHGFTTASTGSLFNGVIQSLVQPGNVNMYINNEVLCCIFIVTVTPSYLLQLDQLNGLWPIKPTHHRYAMTGHNQTRRICMGGYCDTALLIAALSSWGWNGLNSIPECLVLLTL